MEREKESACVCACVCVSYLECSTGIEHLVRMLPMMMASLRVQVPDSHSGIRIPAEGKLITAD